MKRNMLEDPRVESPLELLHKVVGPLDLRRFGGSEPCSCWMWEGFAASQLRLAIAIYPTLPSSSTTDP